MTESLKPRNFSVKKPDNKIETSGRKIKEIILGLIERNSQESQEILTEIQSIKEEIQKISQKIDTLIQLYNPEEMCDELKEAIKAFEFLVETKKITQDNLVEKIQKLKIDKVGLLNDKKQLEQQVSKDPLTEVFNRWKFDEVLEQLFTNMKLDDSKPLSLSLIDLDNFKNINDSYGHTTWDSVLQHVAQLLKNTFQESMSTAVFRYGWEEFAILSRKNQDDIYQDLQWFLYELRKSQIKTHPDIWLSASIWITQYDKQLHSSKTSFIDDADEKLYASKNNGKNQITV